METSFANNLKELANAKVTAAKTAMINEIIKYVRETSKYRAQEGFFNNTYNSRPLPEIIMPHIEEIKETIQQILSDDGFSKLNISELWARDGSRHTTGKYISVFTAWS